MYVYTYSTSQSNYSVWTLRSIYCTFLSCFFIQANSSSSSSLLHLLTFFLLCFFCLSLLSLNFEFPSTCCLHNMVASSSSFCSAIHELCVLVGSESEKLIILVWRATKDFTFYTQSYIWIDMYTPYIWMVLRLYNGSCMDRILYKYIPLYLIVAYMYISIYIYETDWQSPFTLLLILTYTSGNWSFAGKEHPRSQVILAPSDVF